MQHTVIPSWYQREGYVTAMANLIEKELLKFNRSEEVLFLQELCIYLVILYYVPNFMSIRDVYF